jgi:hypothetical protein
MTGGKRRHQMIADKKLQGALLAHTTIYWFYCLFSVTLIAVCWIILSKQPESSAELFTLLWLNCGPALLGSVVLLPLVLLDCLKLSSRFAGPMVRMQRVMRELAAGENPPDITLRPKDYWMEFAADFNLVMERLRQQDSQTHATHPSTSAMSKVVTTQPQSDKTESGSVTLPVSPIGLPLDGECSTHSMYSNL